MAGQKQVESVMHNKKTDQNGTPYTKSVKLVALQAVSKTGTGKVDLLAPKKRGQAEQAVSRSPKRGQAVSDLNGDRHNSVLILLAPKKRGQAVSDLRDLYGDRQSSSDRVRSLQKLGTGRTGRVQAEYAPAVRKSVHPFRYCKQLFGSVAIRTLELPTDPLAP